MQDAPRIYRFSSPEALTDSPVDLRLFAGRDDELVQIFRLLQTSNSAVIYGQPGVGRSSLMGAGVRPLLRERGFLPITFSWGSGTEEQPFTGIAEGLVHSGEAPIKRAAEKVMKAPDWTLTELFQAAAEPLAKSKRPVVILIDDFETIFPLYSVEARERMMRELAYVLLKRYPTEPGSAQRGPWKEAPPVKLLISLHEGQLASLDEFREYLPELLTRRVRVAAPNFQQAVQILRLGAAEELPGAACEPFALDDEIALPLLAHSRLRNPGPQDAGKELYDLFVLKILAAHVESLMIEAQKPVEGQVTEAAAESESDEEVGLAFDPARLPKLVPELLLSYYQERVGSLPAKSRAKVQNLMEASLYGGISQQHGVTRRLLEAQYGLEPAMVDELTRLRLLRATVANQTFSYCLWHDSLREGIRLIRRAELRKSLRRKGYALVALAACAAVSFHLMPQEKLGRREAGLSVEEGPSLRDQYADQPERLESLLRLNSQGDPSNPRPLWDLASLQEEQGRNAEALETLRQLEKITPPDAPPLLRRKALVMERLGLENEAVEVKTRLLQVLEQPRSEIDAPGGDVLQEIARIYHALGKLREGAGRAEEAKSHYQRAIEAIGKSGATGEAQQRELAELHTSLGELALKMEMPQEAAAAFEQALNASPEFQPALQGRARLNLSQGREAAAADDLAKITAKSPDNLLASYEQARALQTAGRNEEALKILEDLIAKYPQNASLLLRKAQVLLSRNDKEAALVAFNKALELDPRNSDALLGRAQILSEQDRSGDAIADYTKVIELQPDQARAYGNRGILYRKLGQLEKALADYNMVLKLEPDDAHIHYLRGNLLLDNNRLEEALADFGKAAELDPDNARAYNNRGFVHSLLGRFKEAITDFGKAIELDPVYAEAYSNRGFAIYSDSQSTQALADFHRAIILEPGAPHNYINRGRYYLEIDEYESALKDFDKAIELDPEVAEAYQFRSQVQAKLGQNERAQADAAKAQELDSGGS